jgi:hypothetical protein
MAILSAIFSFTITVLKILLESDKDLVEKSIMLIMVIMAAIILLVAVKLLGQN